MKKYLLEDLERFYEEKLSYVKRHHREKCESIEELEMYDRLEEVRKMILELNESVE